MGEICDEQNEQNRRDMQKPEQANAQAGRIRRHDGDVDKGTARLGADHGLQGTQG